LEISNIALAAQLYLPIPIGFSNTCQQAREREGKLPDHSGHPRCSSERSGGGANARVDHFFLGDFFPRGMLQDAAGSSEWTMLSIDQTRQRSMVESNAGYP
jgi:hypothetical protein